MTVDETIIGEMSVDETIVGEMSVDDRIVGEMSVDDRIVGDNPPNILAKRRIFENGMHKILQDNINIIHQCLWTNKKAGLGSEDYQKATEAVFRYVKERFNGYEGKLVC
ncbi:hypothetical protein GLOIN_2v1783519 [Rhizophagus irregularis DAOM 181602=DAOM 197198]|uniref:Uncharacterized protein n=1 Tax=Rhizophagus irregularis (strain DAOM 181602 / DAOM 197198 / MUCL 43194) TaxID=747089 RepID=U9TFH8_RHIID|nr:hypothetical protein GLOIN_2v1783519 [Rhizophagus irregularis DAOM 181602=DAOM 197198]